jgi:hypothetical protein
MIKTFTAADHHFCDTQTKVALWLEEYFPLPALDDHISLYHPPRLQWTLQWLIEIPKILSTTGKQTCKEFRIGIKGREGTEEQQNTIKRQAEEWMANHTLPLPSLPNQLSTKKRDLADDTSTESETRTKKQRC